MAHGHRCARPALRRDAPEAFGIVSLRRRLHAAGDAPARPRAPRSTASARKARPAPFVNACSRFLSLDQLASRGRRGDNGAGGARAPTPGAPLRRRRRQAQAAPSCRSCRATPSSAGSTRTAGLRVGAVGQQIGNQALARRAQLSATRRSTELFKSDPTVPARRRPGSRSSVRDIRQAARPGLSAAKEKRPRGAAFTSHGRRERSGRRSYFLAPRRRQPAPVLPALRSAFGLRLALGRGSCPRLVVGCVACRPCASPAGAILPALASAFGLRLALGRGSCPRRSTAAWSPALPSPAGASLPAFCASAVSALRFCAGHRRGGLGEGALREHGDGRGDGAQSEFGLH